MTDEQPKSAFELAMERLRKQDADQGVSERQPTADQKAAIAEARSVHAAKVAELKILHRSTLASSLDPAERARVDDEHRREVQRVGDECDRKIAKIRQP